MNQSAAFRAHLLRHHLDPDAFAELPDGTQTEILQTLGDMEAPSEVLAGAHGAASLDEGSLVQQGDGLRAQCDRDRAHSSQGSWSDADDENDGGAELESGLEQWMQAQYAAPVLERDHQAPANPSALPPDLLQLLQRHGIAVDAFADMPQDIQSEILQSLSEFDDSASQMSADSEDSLSAEYRRHELEQLMATPAAAPGPVYPERATLPHRPSPVVPTPPLDSRVIFSMGFELALVRRALRYPPPFLYHLSHILSPSLIRALSIPLQLNVAICVTFISHLAAHVVTMRLVPLKCCCRAQCHPKAPYPCLDLHLVTCLNLHLVSVPSRCLLARPAACRQLRLPESVLPHNRSRMLLSRRFNHGCCIACSAGAAVLNSNMSLHHHLLLLSISYRFFWTLCVEMVAMITF